MASDTRTTTTDVAGDLGQVLDAVVRRTSQLQRERLREIAVGRAPGRDASSGHLDGLVRTAIHQLHPPGSGGMLGPTVDAARLAAPLAALVAQDAADPVPLRRRALAGMVSHLLHADELDAGELLADCHMADLVTALPRTHVIRALVAAIDPGLRHTARALHSTAEPFHGTLAELAATAATCTTAAP